MKSYLLVFDGDQASRRSIASRLDSLSEVVNWMAFFDNAFCVVSDLDALDLSRLVRETASDVQFIVVALERGKRNGWLPKSVWDFMNHPSGVESVA